jgi:hypothetical protein
VAAAWTCGVQRGWRLTLERLRAAGNPRGVAALEGIGGDPTRWDLGAWNTGMAWAFRADLPTPNLDRRLLFPLALTSPSDRLADLSSLFTGFWWSTAQMLTELRAGTPGGSAPGSRSGSSCSRARPRCSP